eukprot:TRINITY_DN16054_c0_g1_i1.p1 TRINITY_DN16054_c0_g1~~TRINITY_DN16054_c0_g1_i1.p1  ORF type:complete len:557 (+),score=125.39 TRINITY_DN16054_c0_g1_i1:762-2432(+)
MQACRLLERISNAQAKEIEALTKGSRQGGPSVGEADKELGLEKDDEWVLQPNLQPLKKDSRVKKALAAAADIAGQKGQSEDGLVVGAIILEACWWLENLKKQEHRQYALNGEHAFWILKDPGLNCGRGINVFAEIMPLLEEASNSQWNMVVQKYLERPLLVGHDRRKCDVRLWVVVTSWNPAVIWAWPEPYLRLASRPFSWDKSQVSDPFVHLTNRTVQKFDGSPGEGATPPQVKEPPKEDEAHIWLLPRFLAWAQDGLTEIKGGARSCWNTFTWPKMLEAVRTCVQSCREDVGAHPSGCFELFGFDFLLDSEMRPWLLEANSSPDLCEDAGPSLRGMTETAVTELLQLAVGLQGDDVQLPTGLAKPQCDQTVPGSGHWHLVHREEVALGAKDLQLRRAIRAARRPQSMAGGSTAARRANRNQHLEVVRAVLGQDLKRSIPSVTALPQTVTPAVRQTELVLASASALPVPVLQSPSRLPHRGYAEGAGATKPPGCRQASPSQSSLILPKAEGRQSLLQRPRSREKPEWLTKALLQGQTASPERRSALRHSRLQGEG